MIAVFCKYRETTGWQAMKVVPAQEKMPIRIVNGLLRITTAQRVRGGRFVNPRKLVN